MMRKLFLLLAATLLPMLAGAAAEPMAPEQAFRLSARALDPATIEVRYAIADEYYLYRDKFRFALEPAEAKVGSVELPPGKEHVDEFFGAVQTYRGDLKFAVPVTAPAGLARVKLTVTSQGCWDQGICYPPTAQSVTVALAGASAPGGGVLAEIFGAKPEASAAPDVAPAGAPTADGASGDESSRIAQMMRDAGFWLLVASFFGFGLLLAFTPCVFPMIPILSSIIVGHGPRLSKSRALGLSGAYVLGMAVTYAIAGVAAALSGTLLSAALQNPWVLGAFAAVFVLLALSMFGFYELQLPAALQTRLSQSVNQRKAGSVAGVSAMGALSAIIVGPCVAAPLAGALLYIAQTGDAVLGGTALVLHGAGHRRAARRRRRFRAYAAAQGRAVDGSGEEVLRRDAARRRDLAGDASRAGARGDARLGGAADLLGDVPARARPAAAARPRLATLLEGRRRGVAAGRRRAADRRARRQPRPAATAGGPARRRGGGGEPLSLRARAQRSPNSTSACAKRRGR